MIFRTDFYQLVQTTLGVALYPQVVPQDAPLPAASYQLVSAVQPQRTLEGGITLQSHSWQVDIYSPDRAALDALANRLSALDGTSSQAFQRMTVSDGRDGIADTATALRTTMDIVTTNRRNRV